MKKRVLSLTLAVILALGVMPVTAGAAEEPIVDLTLNEAEVQVRSSLLMNDALKGKIIDVLETYKPNTGGYLADTMLKVPGQGNAQNCAYLALYTYDALFGYYYAKSGSKDSYLKFFRGERTTPKTSVSYRDFASNGIYPGAHIRTDAKGSEYGSDGHSMILLDYDKNYIWVYQGGVERSNGYAGVKVTRYTWDAFNKEQLSGRTGKKNPREINHISVPKDYMQNWMTQEQRIKANLLCTLYGGKEEATTDSTVHSTLRSGSRGGEVKTLQTMLNAVSGAGLAVDGGFGSKTLAAVKSFQRSKGLAVDGVVGTKTWAALEAEYNKPAPEPTPASEAARPEPTPAPTPAPAPAQPEPAQPTPDQSGKISLLPSVLTITPVTAPTQGMPQGQPFYFKGVIISNYPIVFARVAILTSDRADAIAHKNIQPNTLSVDIATSGLDSLKFGNLQPGSYVLYLTATDSSGAVKEWSADFSIAASHATLRQGSKGDEVRLLQTMLNQIMGAGLAVDGGFGAKTLAAVKSYQSARGLAVDGVVGTKTWAALESEYRR